MVYALDLDITPSGVPQIVKLSQYDKTMPQLVINLYNGAQPFTIPTGCTAYIEGTKADKTGFQYTCAITNNAITADITEQMTAFAGRVACEVVLRKSGERKGSANFFLDIEPAALSDDTILSDSDLPILQQIPETLAECENYANLAHQWATYGSDSEEPSATNNSKYWAEKSQEYAVGALHWKGSIAFANIPTSGMVTGDLYNITDDFITDNRFTEGAGIECPAGTDIVWGANGKWDLPLSATNATQVKYGNTTVADELNQINTSLSDKQDSTDNSLTTTDKTITGAINELNSNLSDLISGDSEPVTQYSQIQRHTRVQIAGEIPTASNIVTLFNALNTTGSYIVDFRKSGEQSIRSTGLFSIVNTSYGAGIIVSYYNDSFYKVVNSNGNVTITPM